MDKDVAETFLQFGFSAEDKARMAELAQAARNGDLAEVDEAEMDGYERIGHLISLLKSKARVSLKSA